MSDGPSAYKARSNIRLVIEDNKGESQYRKDRVYIEAVHDGDPERFTEFVTEYIDQLTRYAFSFLGDEDAAHDIVQDVFARIWQLGTDWNPDVKVAPYLFLAVRRRSLNMLRDDNVRKKAHEALVGHLENTLVSHDPYSDVALAAKVAQEIEKLTDRQRDALRIRYGQGLKMREVAEILGIDIKSAERLVARGLEALRLRLARVWKERRDKE